MAVVHRHRDHLPNLNLKNDHRRRLQIFLHCQAVLPAKRKKYLEYENLGKNMFN